MLTRLNEIALFDASGRRIKRPGAQPPAGGPAKAPPADPATIEAFVRQVHIDHPEPTILSPLTHACLEVKAASVSFIIQATVNLNTSPFAILEGSIGGDICNVPGTHWQVVNDPSGNRPSYFGNTGLVIEGARFPTPDPGPFNCAESIIIVGFVQGPNAYGGFFWFNGFEPLFPCTVLFKGWQPCANVPRPAPPPLGNREA